MTDELKDIDVVAELNNIKATTVPKAEYDKLKAKNNQLLNAVLHGDKIDATVDIKTELQWLANERGRTNDLDFMTRFTNLRKQIIADTGKDPCLTSSSNAMDATIMEQAIEQIEQAIADSEGDNIAFKSRIKRLMNIR